LHLRVFALKKWPPPLAAISWGVHPIARAGQKRHFGVMAEVVLEIENLTHRFGAFTAVAALTLSVNVGEFFGQRGFTGADKTIRTLDAMPMGEHLLVPAREAVRLVIYD
jgi:hypothetical protein